MLFFEKGKRVEIEDKWLAVWQIAIATAVLELEARLLRRIVKSLSKALCRRDVTVLMLDRPRHADYIKQCREAGARIRLISDGDVGGAIETAKADAPVDVMMGIGGTPEGVIAGVTANAS